MTTELSNRVLALIRKHVPVSGRDGLGDPDVVLASLGLDSLLVAGLLADLEEHFAVTFPDDRITRDTFRSPRTIETAIRELLAEDRSR